jgi:hypothetical protein
MTRRYVSVSFAARVLCFSLVYDAMELILGYVGTQHTSILWVVSNFVAGIFLAVMLSVLFAQLPFRRAIRIGVAWPALFVVQEFSNLVEGYFFTTYIQTIYLFFAATFNSLLVTLIEALLVGFLFAPEKVDRSFVEEFRAYTHRRPWRSWILRIVAGSVVYFPIYFLFGALISPFVLPYYESSSMGLRIPSFTVMIPLELVRGFLYVLALLPIIALLRGERKYVFAGVASLLYVAGAVVPFLAGPGLPVQLRVFHGVEILADSLVYGAALAYLFAFQSPST